MKTLSVLFTLTLLFTTGALAARLKHLNSLPTRPTVVHSNFHPIEHIQ